MNREAQRWQTVSGLLLAVGLAVGLAIGQGMRAEGPCRPSQAPPSGLLSGG